MNAHNNERASYWCRVLRNIVLFRHNHTGRPVAIVLAENLFCEELAYKSIVLFRDKKEWISFLYRTCVLAT